MALRGTLEDMGIIQLIQFPHASRKSGELIITSSGERAHLFYERGKLLHAEENNLMGMDVLIKVVGWSIGAFEFHVEVPPPKQSIEMDLHRALMQALKIRDEQQAMPPVKAPDSASPLREVLRRFLSENKNIYSASITGGTAESTLLAQEGQSAALDEKIFAMLQLHPRPGLKRLFIEDEEGIVVAFYLPEAKRFAILLASPKSSLGAASMASNKLARKLSEQRDALTLLGEDLR